MVRMLLDSGFVTAEILDTKDRIGRDIHHFLRLKDQNGELIHKEIVEEYFQELEAGRRSSVESAGSNSAFFQTGLDQSDEATQMRFKLIPGLGGKRVLRRSS